MRRFRISASAKGALYHFVKEYASFAAVLDACLDYETESPSTLYYIDISEVKPNV